MFMTEKEKLKQDSPGWAGILMAKKYRTDGTSIYSLRPMPGSTTSPELEQLKKNSLIKKKIISTPMHFRDITILS